LQEWFRNTFHAAYLSEARTQFVGRLHKINTFHRPRVVEREESVR
jgi:hypothetical protein